MTSPSAKNLLDPAALRQEDPAGRREAVAFWEAVGEALPSALEALLAAGRDPDRAVREKAVQALARLGRNAYAALPTLRSALKASSLWDTDEAIRFSALAALLHDAEPSRPPLEELIRSLDDPSAPNRFSAAQALGERGQESSPAVGLLLQKALNDPDAGVRIEAAMALYKIDRRVDKILPFLVHALQDPDEVRRWVAADCLGEIGPAAREAIPHLREALGRESRSGLIRKSLSLALAKISGTAES